jgi:hypothetical protein
MSKQAYVKRFFEEKHGRTAEPEDVWRYVQRLNRQLRPKGASKSKARQH